MSWFWGEQSFGAFKPRNLDRMSRCPFSFAQHSCYGVIVETKQLSDTACAEVPDG
jgi:hypothetical protein